MYKHLLEKFLKEIKKHKEVIAVAFTGSTGTGKFHKYSDLDIDLIVKDKDYDKLIKKIPLLFKVFGKVKFTAQYTPYLEFLAYIGEDLLKVEIEPIKWSWLNPYYELANLKIIYDRDGRFTKVHKKSKKIKLMLPKLKETVNFFLLMRDEQHYAARHFVRGKKYSAMSELNNITHSLFQFLAKIKRMKDYELIRNAEKILSKKEMKMFLQAKCKSFDKKEIIRSSKANWQLMKYIENVYEKKAKRKLKISCNDQELLNWLNKLYRK